MRKQNKTYNSLTTAGNSGWSVFPREALQGITLWSSKPKWSPLDKTNRENKILKMELGEGERVRKKIQEEGIYKTRLNIRCLKSTSISY